jgi:hypothetical protein
MVHNISYEDAVLKLPVDTLGEAQPPIIDAEALVSNGEVATLVYSVTEIQASMSVLVVAVIVMLPEAVFDRIAASI